MPGFSGRPSLEHLNQQLRDLEHAGALDWATTEPTGYHRCDAPGCPYAASRLVVRSEPDQWVLQMACEEHERYFFAVDAPSEVLETFGTEMADGVARLPVRALAKSDPASLPLIRLVTDRYPFRPEVVPTGP